MSELEFTARKAKYLKLVNPRWDKAFIATYSINVPFATRILTQANCEVVLVLNKKFTEEAILLKDALEGHNIRIYLHPETHLKMLYFKSNDGLEKNLHISTANFNESNWYEADFFFSYSPPYKDVYRDAEDLIERLLRDKLTTQVM